MASEDEDLELLLSMQEDEEAVVRGTPPPSPAVVKDRPVRREEAGGFYSQTADPAALVEVEGSTFSTRMAEITSSFAARFKGNSSSTRVQKSNAQGQIDVSSSTISSNFRRKPSGTTNGLGYCSDDDSSKSKNSVSMDAFKEVVKNTLNVEANKLPRANPKQEFQQTTSISSIDVEFFSGLKIKNRLLPPAEVYHKLQDLRFVRLPAIKMASECGKFAGSWATAGILVEKGQPRQSSAGKNFVIWKLGTLDSRVVSVFLFGDAYKVHWKEQPGTILAVLSASIRADPKTKVPSLSVFHCDQLMVLGTSANFAMCRGTRKDGTSCTVAIDKRLHGEYCQYHLGAQQQKYKTKRPELSGGKMAIVGPGYERGHIKRKHFNSPEKEINFSKPLKTVSSSQMKTMLSDEKFTSKNYSQGKRFLETMAERVDGKTKRPMLGAFNRATSASKEAADRTHLVGKPKHVDLLKAQLTTSREKPKSKSEMHSAAPPSRENSGTERVRTKRAFVGNSQSDDEEMEIDWSDGPDDEMVYAWSGFSNAKVPSAQHS